MTTEPTQSSQDAGQGQASAPGQGHRRRRRRRKSKGTQAQGAQPQPQQQGAQPTPAAAPLLASGPQNSGSQGGGSQNNGQQSGSQGQAGQGSGRKKKKRNRSRDRDRDREPRDDQTAFLPPPSNNYGPPNVNGNGNGNGGGMRRKNLKQRGPRQFVGPMDHSYRTVNGNVADGPPSTIPTHANGNAGGYYSDVVPFRSAVPAIPENAHTRIFFFLEDLFFLAKIQEVARKLGVKIEFVKGDKEVVTRILEAPEAERPALMVFDLNNANVKPLTLIPKFKKELKKSTSIIGFLSHLQGDLKMKAIEAGCDTVMPRSAFSQSLPNLLRRYGMEEEEEYYPQPV